MTFTDWAGQQIPHRISLAETGADEKFVCELDPHGCAEWTVFGRGATGEDALKSAEGAWNAYDHQP